jgi:hypothetical protein
MSNANVNTPDIALFDTLIAIPRSLNFNNRYPGTRCLVFVGTSTVSAGRRVL